MYYRTILVTLKLYMHCSLNVSPSYASVLRKAHGISCVANTKPVKYNIGKVRDFVPNFTFQTIEGFLVLRLLSHSFFLTFCSDVCLLWGMIQHLLVLSFSFV